MSATPTTHACTNIQCDSILLSVFLENMCPIFIASLIVYLTSFVTHTNVHYTDFSEEYPNVMLSLLEQYKLSGACMFTRQEHFW